ncbi:hypothetical protein ACVWWP_007386 [Bradyrhizobium sp. LM3.6]
MTELRKQLPFALLGFNTDNDTVFMDETLKPYCDTASIVFARCRPTGRTTRRSSSRRTVLSCAGWSAIVGSRVWKRPSCWLNSIDRRAARELLPALVQVGSQAARRRACAQDIQRAPATPHQRLAGDARTTDAVRVHLQELYAALDPVALLRDILAAQERLTALADTQRVAHAAMASQQIDIFLESLRTARKEEGLRPTDRPIAKAKRGRRRPDPLIVITPDLRKWFEAEPWRTDSVLLSRLQVEYPGACPKTLLRTLQHRLKSWRSEQANALLFAPTDKTPSTYEVTTPQ